MRCLRLSSLKWLLVGLSWYREQAIRGEWLAAVVLLLHLLNGDALKIALVSTFTIISRA